MEKFGVKLKSPRTGEWFWFLDRNGEIKEFTKQQADARAKLWNNTDVAKVVKITAAATKKKTKKKVTKKKVTKKKVTKKKVAKKKASKKKAKKKVSKKEET